MPFTSGRIDLRHQSGISTYSLVFALLLCAASSSCHSGSGSTRSEHENVAIQTHAGRIKMSTSPNGFWTFVTTSTERGDALQSAFAIQHAKPLRPGIFAEGSGQAFTSKYAIAVHLTNGRDWLFTTGRYRTQFPISADEIRVVGIARYYLHPKGPQKTHEDFVKSGNWGLPCSGDAQDSIPDGGKK